LFIALIYGSAVIVSGASPYLTNNQRWVLVFFDAAFPNIVLYVFYVLVTKHHFKLYAPSDWKDERRVFGPQSFETKLAKEEEEVQEIAASEDTAERVDVSDPNRTLPPHPRTTLTVEAKRSLRALVQEAEELAFRRLSSEYVETIHKDVSVSAAGRFIAFDGVISTDERLALIEVKVLRSMKNLRNLVESARTNALIVAADFEAHGYYGLKLRRLEFIFVLVTDRLNEEQQKNAERIAMQILDSQSLVRPTLKLFNLEELREWEKSRAANP